MLAADTFDQIDNVAPLDAMDGAAMPRRLDEPAEDALILAPRDFARNLHCVLAYEGVDGPGDGLGGLLLLGRHLHRLGLTGVPTGGDLSLCRRSLQPCRCQRHSLG